MPRYLYGDLIFLITAMIWGSTFIVQKTAMEGIGPITYTGLRFVLGGMVLLPFLFFIKFEKKLTAKDLFLSSTLGLVLFLGINLQQLGLVYTIPSKTAFLTSFYIVLVPTIAIFFRQKIGKSIWVSCVISIVAVYCIAIPEDGGFGEVNIGDVFALGSALFFAFHILMITWLASNLNVIFLAIFQNFFCGFLSLLFGFIFEFETWQNINMYWYEIAYGGILSIAVAYTLQIYGQNKAPASHAAIILSLEAVFAALTEFLVLDYPISDRVYIGFLLMFIAFMNIYTGKIYEKFSGMIKKIPRPN